MNLGKHFYTNVGRAISSSSIGILCLYSENNVAIIAAIISNLFSYFWIFFERFLLSKRLTKFVFWIPAVHDVFLVTILIYVTGNISSPNVIFYIAILTISISEGYESRQPIAIMVLSNFCYVLMNVLILENELESISILSNSFYQELTAFNVAVCQFFLMLCQAVLFLVVSRISKENKKNFEVQVSLKKKAEDTVKQLKEAELRLTRTEKMAELGQLVSSISHEINTPLSIIKSNVELMDYDVAVILKQVPSFLENISSEERRIFNDIISDLKITSSSFIVEERQRRKAIKTLLKKIFIDGESDPYYELFIELCLKLRTEDIVEDLINYIGVEKSLKLLKIAEIFFNLNKYLERIKISIDKTNKIIFALKNYSNTNNHSEKIQVNLVSEFQRILRLYDNYITGRVVTKIEVADNIQYYCNKENVFQVWNNLIYNSIQSLLSSGKKRLEINAIITDNVSDILKNTKGGNKSLFTEPREYLVVSIVDNGMGISPMFQDKLFQPFFTTKTLGEGIGLGLFISKKIIQDHGGDIFFYSDSEKTEFTVVLF